MYEIQAIIQKIKETNYDELNNGKSLKELDFMELESICEELVQEIEMLKG